MSKLWLLKQSGSRRYAYDEALEFVIRATTERMARRIASENCGDEESQTWLDNDSSSCVELKKKGKSGVIVRDFNAG